MIRYAFSGNDTQKASAPDIHPSFVAEMPHLHLKAKHESKLQERVLANLVPAWQESMLHNMLKTGNFCC